MELMIAQRKACGMALLRASPRTPSPSPDGEAAPTKTLARTGILLARASRKRASFRLNFNSLIQNRSTERSRTPTGKQATRSVPQESLKSKI